MALILAIESYILQIPSSQEKIRNWRGIRNLRGWEYFQSRLTWFTQPKYGNVRMLIRCYSLSRGFTVRKSRFYADICGERFAQLIKARHWSSLERVEWRSAEIGSHAAGAWVLSAAFIALMLLEHAPSPLPPESSKFSLAPLARPREPPPKSPVR